MEKVIFVERTHTDKLFRIAQWLAVATIFYNVIEGLVSVYFGFEDESLALFGYGVDNSIEFVQVPARKFHLHSRECVGLFP